MTYRAATKDEKAILQAAVDAGLVEDKLSARSRFLNDVKRDPRSARAAVAASSVRSGDKPKRPATITSRNPSGKQPQVTTERPKPSSPVVAAAPVTTPIPAPAPVAASVEYPTGWGRLVRRAQRATSGTGTAAASTASGRLSAARANMLGRQPAQPVQPGHGVHASGETTRLIQAQRQREQANVTASQAGRNGLYDRHSLIAAAGDNAQRLADAQRAELDRMARERRGHTAG